MSFTLLTIGLVVALYFGIGSFRRISESAETLAKPDRTPVFISQLLVDLVEAEGQFRSYSLTQQDSFLLSYQKKNLELTGWIDSLRQTSGEQAWQNQLDSLSNLINLKMRGLNDFMALKSALDERDITDKTFKKLTRDASRPVKVNKALTTTETQTKQQIKAADKVKVEPIERKGLLSKLFGKERTTTVIVPSDSNLTTTTREVTVDTITISQQPSDAVIANVKTTLRRLQEKETLNRRQLSDKELFILSNDQRIMTKMRVIIRDLEQEEFENSKRSIDVARRSVDQSLVIIFMVVCTGLLTSVIFAVLAIRDISKSNSYKNQLVKAKTKAEKLSQVKEEFLANMSHEMRTPLNAIQGFSEQLEQANLPYLQQEQVQAIRHSSEFLLATVNDILDMSKIEAGHLTFEKLHFNLLEIAQKCVSIMAPRAISKGLRFEEDLPVAPAWVKGDPFRLQQIIFNLLGNAIKFTDQGAVRLRMRARDNGYGTFVVDISVLDTGIGISNSKLNTIFSSFTQADNSITRRFGGTGLGLSITRRLVELQGGQINVRSRAGRGTLFYLSIPYEQGQAQASPLHALQTTAQIRTTDWHDRRILVVDDDHLNGLLLTTILEKWKIPHTLAGNAQEAISALEHRNFDLILTDMHMPGMSGLELLMLVKESYPGLPVAVVTANAQKQDLKNYLNQGMTDYLVKPYTENDLKELLARIWPEDTVPEPVKLDNATPVSILKVQPKVKYSLVVFEQYAGGDADALQLMLQSFLVNTRANFAEAEHFAGLNQINQVKELAHKMYPAVKQLQADEAAGILQALELEANNVDEVVAYIKALKPELEDVFNYVEKEVAQLT